MTAPPAARRAYHDAIARATGWEPGKTVSFSWLDPALDAAFEAVDHDCAEAQANLSKAIDRVERLATAAQAKAAAAATDAERERILTEPLRSGITIAAYAREPVDGSAFANGFHSAMTEVADLIRKESSDAVY